MKRPNPWILITSVSVFVAFTPSVQAKTKAELIIEKYDKNGDGVLDVNELAVYFNDENLKTFDTPPKDGIITSEEVLKTVDPTARAQKLLDQVGTTKANELDLKVGLKLDPIVKEQDPLAWISKAIKLRKSYLTESKDANDPARLSWTWSRHDSSYAFDGALSLPDQLLLDNSTGFSIGSAAASLELVPTVEAHVSNAKSDSPDSVAFGVPLHLLVNTGSSNSSTWNVTGYSLALIPDFETDSRFDIKTFTINPVFTLNMPGIALGRGQPIGTSDILFSWRPYLGFELGRVIDDHDEPGLQEKSTISRLLIKGRAELDITERFTIVGLVECRQQLDSEGHTFIYGEISPQINLDANDHFAVGLTLKSGKQPPKFQDQHSANFWVGLKF